MVDLIDDINGKPAVETVLWSLDGEDLVMDLTAANAAKFRRRIDVFRKASRKAVKQRNKAVEIAAPEPTSKEIRAWAKANGLSIADKGYIPTRIREAFNNRNE